MWVNYKKIGDKSHRQIIEYIPIQYEMNHFNPSGELIKWHRIEYTAYKSLLENFISNEIFAFQDKGDFYFIF